MRLGIDLGGTKIEAIALDDQGKELARHRMAAPQGNYDDTLEALDALVSKLEGETGEKGTIGIGMPGALDARTGLIKNANSTWLIGKPMDKDLERILGRPVRMANDANCFALSEAMDGAGKDAETVFGVILGTGCGGGIVVDKKILVGANRIAGEWGHNALPNPRDHERPGPQCYCGKFGCLETWISGSGLAAHHNERTGHQLTAHEIALLEAAGDEEAHRSFCDLEDRIARALGVIVNIIDPDVIVLGGGLSNVDRIYENVPALLAAHVMSDNPIINLQRNHFGDSSGVRGAAWLWPPTAPRAPKER